jgi:eukaryotic-like serine/threonine-protein kinase
LPREDEYDLILNQGTPVAWAYVALENGVLAHYPGHDKFPSPYDATKRPWYQLVEGQRGPRWGSPHVDFGGLGLMLPCSMSLYDDNGVHLGVAGIELSFDFIIDRLLEAPELANVAETYMLDAGGRIVIQSSDKARAGTDSALGKRLVRMKRFPFEKVTAAALARPSGHMTLDTPQGKQLFVWDRMKSTGWTYVIRGPEREVMKAVVTP